MIKLDNISFKYDKTILENINLEIDKNKVTFIIGKNGSGKSTLAHLISGLLHPYSGTIKLDDLLLTKKTNNLLIRQKIGIVFQNPNNQILFTSVKEDIKFTLENMHIPRENIDDIITESLKKVDMEMYLDTNPYNLSGGQKQRIAIASQLSLQPDYLIFDESTSMLDPKGKKDIYKLLKTLKKEMGIIFITNNIDELKYADDIIIIDNKSIYKYSINDIINNNNILTKHKLEIPFIFKIANTLNIKDINNINEKYIIERLNDK